MPNKRTCGTCTECCKTHPVDELQKLAGKWCRYRVKDKGCRVYDSRPNGCREFECQWLKGHGDETDRPDLTGIVIDYYPLETLGKTALLYESRTEALVKKYGKELIAQFVDNKLPVLQRFLSGREILLVPRSLPIPLDKLQTLAHDKRKVYLVEVRT